MKEYQTYIDEYVYTYLCSFGDLNGVCNHCIQKAIDEDMWLTMDVPPARTRDDKRIRVLINNDEYEQLSQLQRQTYSLRRLLYHIAYNELLEDGDYSFSIEASKTSILTRLKSLQTSALIVMREAIRRGNKYVYECLKDINEQIENIIFMEEITDAT